MLKKASHLALAADKSQLIGYWGCGEISPTFPPLELNFTPQREASLAASGLSNLPDIWVRMDEESLCLGRDIFGRVTLYWLKIGQVIWFASRIQLLLPLLPHPQVDLAGFYGYTCLSYVPTPLSPIQGINALPAGVERRWRVGELEQPLTLSLGEWQEAPELNGDETAATYQLESLLEAAIQQQSADLQGKTVGIFLSGGLDSSLVAAFLKKTGIKLRAYTLDFGKEGIPEYPYAEQVAEVLAIPLTKVTATPKTIQPLLNQAILALDTPFGDGVTLPLYLLAREASLETDTIFNGEGGDQLFGGWTNKPLIAASIYEGEGAFLSQYLETFHRLWGYEEEIFTPSVLEGIGKINPEDWLFPALESGYTPAFLHRLRRASLLLKGAQNIQPRATNLAWAWGLQVRSPFCYLPLAQFTFSLSGELFLRGASEKYILKRIAAKYLPEAIVWRQKRGMGVPLTPWFLGEWWYKLGEWLNPEVLAAEGRWQRDLALRVALGKLSGKIQGRRIGEILWLLLVWQVWRGQILGESRPSPSKIHPFLLPLPFWKYIQK
jgi:asparagine synthase (glutamine-hydrolysing)